jgi:hypothetical protein
MPTDDAIFAGACAGIAGALLVTGIGVRFTRKPGVLACSGVLSGGALGMLMCVLWSWFTHGFELFEVYLPPLAALILLAVMAAQNWFVLYEDRQDVLQSARPAIVTFAAALVSLLAWSLTNEDSFLPYLRVIWAGAGSLALLWCIDPVQRSIERTRSALFGTLIGICKVLLPLTGIIVFIGKLDASRSKLRTADDAALARGARSFALNLVCLFWDLGRLVLTILINGARVPCRPAASDPFESQWQRKSGPSVTGEMPQLKRDSVVMIFVLALHLLGGLLIVKG